MNRGLSLLVLFAAAGCVSMEAVRSTPVVSCADPQFRGVEARLATDVDEPPSPAGGVSAVQRRVQIPNEGRRLATPDGQFALVRALIDTTGAALCSDVLSAGTAAKGEAARRAIHESAFAPGRLGGLPVAVVIDLQLDVRGPGRVRVMTGEELGL